MSADVREILQVLKSGTARQEAVGPPAEAQVNVT